MGLMLLMGLEGRPKTEYLAGRLPAGGKTRILVPDQYTLAAENRYLSLVGEKRMASAEILSFKRFASKVFDEAGGQAFELIGDGGRQALLSKAVHESSPFFTYYPRGFFSMQFVRLLTPMIRELKTAGISPEKLAETASAENNAKLADIALVYGCFEALLAGGFFDPDDTFTRLCRLLDKEKFFAGSVFYVDFFRTFNSGERRVISALLRQDAEVFVTLPCEKIASREDLSLLSEVEVCAGKLRSLAEKCGCSFQTAVFSEEIAGKPEELRFLLKNLFSENRPVFPAPCPGLKFYAGEGIFDEVEFVASEIARLVREEEYCYRDFVVAARNIDDYAGVLDPIFAEYEIPVFYHRRTPLVQKSIALLAVTVLEILAGGLTPDLLITCLKTGFFGYPEEDIFLFENYCALWSVKPGALQKPFVLPVRGLSGKGGEGDALAAIEQIRCDFVSKMDSLRKKTEGASVRDVSAALYEFLIGLGVEEKLQQASETYLRFGEQALYAEQTQVYSLILETLDEIVLACGSDRISPAEYHDLVVSALESKDIAILPTSADEVMTGNMNRLPYLGQKVVFAVGLSEGVFPENPTGDALLSEADKAALARGDVTVGMTNRQKVMYERFLAFFTFTAPEQRLYLTCPEKDGESPFFSEMKRMYPAAEVLFSPLNVGGKALEDRIHTERSAFSVYARTRPESLARFFESSPCYRRLIQPVGGRDLLSPKVSRALFGTDVILRPSRAEQFFLCPFSYFLTDGLKIRLPETARIDGIQVGNFIHEALETLLPEVLKGGDPARLTEGFADRYLTSLLGGEAPTASMREYFSMLEKKAGRVLEKLRKDMPKTGFVPIAYEAWVGGDGPLSHTRKTNGGSVTVRGKIDRIDRLRADRDYFRIVDYKTGDKNISLEKIAAGTEMQMPLYLAEVLASFGENAAPAGVMYLRVNPKIKTVARASSPEAVDRAVWEKSSSGLILDREEVLAAMPESSGRIKKLSEEEFSGIFDTVSRNVAIFADALTRGNLPIRPTMLNESRTPGNRPCPESCRYCPYEPCCLKGEYAEAHEQEK